MSDFSLISFQNVFTIKDGTGYIELNNTVGQKWLIPLKNSKTHLSLFQPSSLKGKLVVAAFNIIKHFPFILKKINARSIRLNFLPQFISFIDDLFHIKQCEIGVFCGSPGKHQKLTLLVANKDSILGYCKLTDNPELLSIFQQEADCLAYLKSKGINNIPESLFDGELPNLKGVYAFIQTTIRNGKVTSANYINQSVFSFVTRMFDLTKKELDYKDSNFCKSVNTLKSYINLFDKEEQNTLNRAIEKIELTLGQSSYYSAYHGDFTPWNSFLQGDKLFVFDFEYFQKYTMPFMDYFHFFTQSSIYNEYLESDKIFNKYVAIKDTIKQNIPNPDFYYTCYLITVMAFYLNRDNGFLNDRIESCFRIWVNLMKSINYEFSA